MDSPATPSGAASPSAIKKMGRVTPGSMTQGTRGTKLSLSSRTNLTPGGGAATPGRLASSISSLSTLRGLSGKNAQPMSRVTPEVAAKRAKVLDSADEAWATVGTRLSLSHAFGCSVSSFSSSCADPVMAFAGPPNDASDKDFSEKVVYFSGNQVCVADIDTGKQQFCPRGREVTRALHMCADSSNTFLSVCESLNRDEQPADTCQVSVYKLDTMQRAGPSSTYVHVPTSGGPGIDFVRSVFCGDASSGNIAALTSDPDRSVVVFSWLKGKVVRLLSLSAATTCLRSSPHRSLMLTTSGPSGGLKVPLFPTP